MHADKASASVVNGCFFLFCSLHLWVLLHCWFLVLSTFWTVLAADVWQLLCHSATVVHWLLWTRWCELHLHNWEVRAPWYYCVSVALYCSCCYVYLDFAWKSRRYFLSWKNKISSFSKLAYLTFHKKRCHCGTWKLGYMYHTDNVLVFSGCRRHT